MQLHIQTFAVHFFECFEFGAPVLIYLGENLFGLTKWTFLDSAIPRLTPNLVCQKVNFHLLAAFVMGVNLDVSEFIK